jgi:TonB-linked SusC/RagA family outer membrane protein
MNVNRWLVPTVVAVAVLPSSLAAQEAATVTGRVTDANGAAVAAALVRIESLSAGTTTGPDGTYRLVVPGSRIRAGQAVTLTVSRQGLATQSRSVTLQPGGASSADFTMATAAVTVEGLVVTALGIEREQKSLSTSVQQISGDQLTQTPTTNVVSSLTGLASGVQVTSVGPQGGSARVVIRGANSIAGNNQPLFVVDGVPIDNSADRNGGFGGIDYGNAASDINPNDIESVSVLKGPNAAALYGSRAANGAIVITTKSGRRTRGLGITVSQDLSFETPSLLPEYQNSFGQGASGRFSYVNGFGGGVNDGVDESWGPALDQGLMIPQYNSPIVNGVRQATPWVSNPNNVRNFFETGRTSNTNVALANSSDRTNVRMSLTHLNQDGMNPGFQMDRTTGSFNGGINLTNRLSANASVQYVRTTGENRTGTGYDDANPMMGFVWFGRQVDVNDLQTYRNEDGTMRSWNYNYHPNPYWIALEAQNNDERDRIIGNASVSYEASDWLKLMVRSGTDWYNESRSWIQPAGTFGLYVGRRGEPVGENGGYEREYRSRQERNTDFLVTADRYVGENLSVVVNLGGNHRTNQFRNDYQWVQNLTVPNVFNLTNASSTPFVDERLTRREVNSLYASANFGFKDFLFIDVTGRNDWSSTLPDGNNSYFYPSLGGSFVFSDVVSLPGVSSGKIRASWARVGNDADPYQLMDAYNANVKFNGLPRFTIDNTIANADLKPETTESWEIGTELGLFDGRLTFDAAYYNKATSDQILAIQVSPASGYANQVVNAGQVDNRGYELSMTAVPVRLSNGFEWEATVNFGRNFSEVVELTDNVETVVLGTYWSLNVEARKGQPYGALFGNGFLRDEAGNLIVSASGLPQRDPVRRVLGNYNPDWVGSLRNSFRFRGLDLSMLFDTKQGGDVYSVTQQWGRYAGVLQETVAGRCHATERGGLPVCTAETGIVVPGVNAAGQPNTVVTNAQNYWHTVWNIHEAHIYDASYVKLREATLGYSLPGSLTRRMGVTSANVAIIGRNLALWTDVPNIDPETGFDASNVQGLEFGQLPTARSVGFSVSVTP